VFNAGSGKWEPADIGTQMELDAHAALQGNGAHVPSGGVTQANASVGSGSTQLAGGDDSRFPTAGQKNALPGTVGTPGTLNPFVTKQDRDAVQASLDAHTGDVALDGGPHGLPALTADGQVWARLAGALGVTKLDARINAKLEYGAVGDGTADDTAAIVAARDAAATTVGLTGRGVGVYCPAGVYKTTAELTSWPDKVSLVGDGPGRTIFKPTGDNFRFIGVTRSSGAP
jgi:hypothetical protein